jgi:hypothetical protein
MTTDFKGQHACLINDTQITPAVSGAMAASMRHGSIRFQFLVQDWPSTQITVAVVKKTERARGYLNWGIGYG